MKELSSAVLASPAVVRVRARLRSAARLLLPRRQPDAWGDVLQAPRSPAFYLGMIVMSLGMITTFASYIVLAGLTSWRPSNLVGNMLVALEAIVLVMMIAVVTLQAIEIVRARWSQSAGARLHWQIVLSSLLIVVLPLMLLAFFTTESLNRAVGYLYSGDSATIIHNSLKVAEAYFDEHKQVVLADTVAMADDMNERAGLFRSDANRFQTDLFQQAQLRSLLGAYVIDGSGRLLADLPPEALNYVAPAPQFLQQAADGAPVFVPPHAGLDQVGAIRKLPDLPGAFLYVVREVNGAVMQQAKAAAEQEDKFRAITDRRSAIVQAYGILQGQLALALLLATTWGAMWFANWLVSPIRRLITAAQAISHGNLDVRVPFIRTEGDLANLSATFNTMTGELKKQRDELVTTNGQLSERGRFIEAVLSGVTAGVIGLDAGGCITLTNKSALQLLARREDELTGHVFGEVLPEMKHLLDKTLAQPKRDRTQEQVDLSIGGAERHFSVQVTREHAGDRDYGFVVTIDDITGLVAAQRTSAWADVARRIAHEIKNPLTPIQLSAERLRRKYGPVITTDRDIFDRCTDTIIRQVGDIGRIVDEFSSFARMPKAQMELQDVAEVVQQAVDLFQLGRADIDFKVVLPKEPVIRYCDRRLLTQAITNLVKNATEAVQAAKELPDADPAYRGLIETEVAADDTAVTISVIDNGCGLPKKDRNRLVEPYMTTRAKGTGIGLAVVNRVTEQHGGTLILEDAPVTPARSQGAAVRMVLSLAHQTTEAETELDQPRSPAMTTTGEAAE